MPPVNDTGLLAWITLPPMSPVACHCTNWPALSVYDVVEPAGAAATPVPAGSAAVGEIMTVVLSVAASTWPQPAPVVGAGPAVM